jgi:hypothetical protein
MYRTRLYVGIWLLIICSVVSLSAQQAAPAAANAVVPPVIKFSGVLTDVNSKPLTGTVGVTFSLYKESQGGAALWLETQNVTADKTGHYSVMLGSTTTQGLPSDVFASGEARWLSVQAQGQAEQPRTVLMSVPYALKAADAETIGGLPPSAFLKAADSRSLPPSTKTSPALAAITGSGTANQVTKWVGPSKLGNSNIFDGPNGNVGINTTSPTARLDVHGTAHIRGTTTVDGKLAATSLSASIVSTGTLSANSSGEAISSVMTGAGNNVAAVAGAATATGDSGFTFGVWGTSASNQGRGVLGQTSGSSGVGVLGEIGSGGTGVGVQGKALPGSNGQGVWGESFNAVGSNGFNPDGVDGIAHNNAGAGVFGTNLDSNGNGVYGIGNAFGVIGQSSSAGGSGGGFANFSTGDGLFAYNQTGGVAAFFDGDVDVDGNLSKASGSFKIDHPLDPANKYLYHSFVESPDMMNIYNGNATTDGQGNAVVRLPEWFETLNRDFRYQLTVIGQFSQAIVASKVENHQFSIKTDKPNVEVSWQVTGIRQDAWANAHRIPVEASKSERDRGLYLHPELFGASEEKSIGLAHHPMMQKLLKEATAK